MSTAADVEYVGRLDASEARALTDQIKTGVEAVWHLITRAYTERAWDALGYSSWDDYCTREFGTSRLRLPREERQEVVSSLRESGLSLRAIASATGHSINTVRKELDEVYQSDTPAPSGTDGVVEAECIHCHKMLPLSRLYEGGQGYECDPCVSPDDPGAEYDDDSIYEAAGHRVEMDSAPAAPKPITGLDGKTYHPQPAAPKEPRRKPITEAFDTANYDLKRVVERVVRLIEDDRFKKNKDQISGCHLSDLIRARDALNGVIQQLEG